MIDESGLAADSPELAHLQSSGQLDALVERLAQLASGPESGGVEERAQAISMAVEEARAGAKLAAADAELLAADKAAAAALRLQLLKVADAVAGEVITAREAALKAATMLKAVNDRTRELVLGMIDSSARAALGLAVRVLAQSKRKNSHATLAN